MFYESNRVIDRSTNRVDSLENGFEAALTSLNGIARPQQEFLRDLHAVLCFRFATGKTPERAHATEVVLPYAEILYRLLYGLLNAFSTYAL